MPIKSRQVLFRLFEGYIKDYGEEAAMQIIKVLINTLGGVRIKIPKAGNKLSHCNDYEEILNLYSVCIQEFGLESAKAILRKFLLELSDQRISFPDWQVLNRMHRNARMRVMHQKGRTPGELAIMFRLSNNQVTRILKKDSVINDAFWNYI